MFLHCFASTPAARAFSLFVAYALKEQLTIVLPVYDLEHQSTVFLIFELVVSLDLQCIQ